MTRIHDTPLARPGGVEGYIRGMVDHPDRVCLPVEMEFIPLYRESGWSARLRREQKREKRRQKMRQRRLSNDPIEPGQEPGQEPGPGAEPEPGDSTVG